MSDNYFENDIYLPNGYHIPTAELIFRNSRAGGPGGQHVNKVETRVELIFDLFRSIAFSEQEKALIRERLLHRIDDNGLIHIISAEHRSQYKNRQETVERLVKMLHHALQPRKMRKATTIPRSVNEKRLAHKRRRSNIKQLRRDNNTES